MSEEDKYIDELEDCLCDNMDLIADAQNLIRIYLEPGGEIQTERELVSQLISLFDGPRQRLILEKTNKVLYD